MEYEDYPKFNEHIVKGIVQEHLTPEGQIKYLDATWYGVLAKLPKGFAYHGCKKCTPVESYNIATKLRGKRPRGKNERGRAQPKKTFDIAKSDVFLAKFQFSYMGKPLQDTPIYLINPKKGGLLDLSGKTWVINQVMVDRLFSITPDEIFLSFITSDRVRIWKLNHPIKKNDKVVPGIVPYAKLHHKAAKNANQGNSQYIKLGYVRSTIGHYLFARYGLEDTFRIHAGVEIQIREFKTTHQLEDELTKEFPREQYTIYSSSYYESSNKPKYVKHPVTGYVAPRIAIIIKNDDINQLTESLIVSAFYTIDHFPEICSPKAIESKWQWIILLGYILFGNDSTHGELGEDILTHLDSIAGYIDTQAKDELLLHRIVAEDIFDVFIYLMSNLMELMTHSAHPPSSMYGKSLCVLKYVLGDITASIVGFMRLVSSNKNKVHTVDTLNSALKEKIKPKLIFKLTGGAHNEIEYASSPNPNYIFKLSTRIIPQRDVKSKPNSDAVRQIEPSDYLDVSICELAGHNVLIKKTPFGREYLNPFARVDPETWELLRKEEYIELLDDAQSDIAR